MQEYCNAISISTGRRCRNGVKSGLRIIDEVTGIIYSVCPKHHEAIVFGPRNIKFAEGTGFKADASQINNKEEITLDKPRNISVSQAEIIAGGIDYALVQKFANSVYGWNYVSKDTYMRTNDATDPLDNGKPGFIYAGSEYVGYVGTSGGDWIGIVFDRNDKEEYAELEVFANDSKNPFTHNRCIGCQYPFDCCTMKDVNSASVTHRQGEDDEQDKIINNKEEDMKIPASDVRVRGEFTFPCVNCKKWHKTANDVRECMGKPIPEGKVLVKHWTNDEGQKFVSTWFKTKEEAMKWATAVGVNTFKRANNSNGFWVTHRNNS